MEAGRRTSGTVRDRLKTIGKKIRRGKSARTTYTKKAVAALLIIGIINAEIPYILAFCGKEPVAELSIAWVTEIVAVILGYMCKSYHETKEQERIRLKEKEMDIAEGGDI